MSKAIGYGVLTLWANAAGVSAPLVRSNFSSTYGESSVLQIGEIASKINFSALEPLFIDAIDNGASKESPTMRDILGAISNYSGESFLNTVLNVGGDITSTAGKAVGRVSSAAVTGLEATLTFLPVVLIVLGVGYLLIQTGGVGKLKGAIK